MRHSCWATTRLGLLAGVVTAVAATMVAPAPALAMAPPDGARLPTGAPASGQAYGAKPRFPLPAKSGQGRRVVYSQRTMHVWAVGAKGRVVRDWKVSGRRDWPNTGTYHVFSKSATSWSPTSGARFRWMVRFTFGHAANIGFHSIPVDPNGKPLQTRAQLGHPVVGGGCVRAADRDARWLYGWAGIGTTVVVLR